MKILGLAILLLPTLVAAQESAGSAANGSEQMILPSWGLKTNLLYDATTTINLGVEFRTGGHTSIDIPVSYNPWKFSDSRQWRHVLVQPEFRWWPRETFRGSFWGLHGHYAFYNVGGLASPPFTDYMSQHRFQGWLAGAGVSYGYRWNFTPRWALEATIGVGYAYLSYDKYECPTCGAKMGSETKNYFGPDKVGISLIYGFGGKRRPASAPAPVPAPAYVAPAAPAPAPAVNEPPFAVSYIAPAVETVKNRTESGKAYLNFIVDRWDILPGLKNNAAELARTDRLVQDVSSDPNATITGIDVTGFASIEGTWAHNLALSERRAASLKDYLRSKYGFSESLFTVRGAGEDWDTLDSLVAASNMPDRDAMLTIMRGTGIFDGREKQLMLLNRGVPYLQMKDKFFPLLRRVDYQIHFTVPHFDVSQAKAIFRTRPGNLSLDEMFQIANTYEPGSDNFNEVFETAARLFPRNDVANINAAASALDRRDLAGASSYLSRVQTRNSAYWNNMAILLWLQGNRKQAVDDFARGGVLGTGNMALISRK